MEPVRSNHSFASSLAEAFAVFIGGTLGTAIRYICSSLPVFSWYFYTGTYLANMLACLFYACLTSYVAQASWMTTTQQLISTRALGTGLCGGLSTMSTMLVEVFTTLRDQRYLSAITYLLISISSGLLFAWIGSNVGCKLASRKQSNR